MVGVPTAGVLGVLQAGRGLRAPHAIGGEWRIGAGPLADSTLVVQQSGEHLSLVVPVNGGVRLTGKLRGNEVELTSPDTWHTPAGRCTPDRLTTLKARVDASASPRRLRGTLVTGAAGCPSWPIDATHVPRAAPRAGGH